MLEFVEILHLIQEQDDDPNRDPHSVVVVGPTQMKTLRKVILYLSVVDDGSSLVSQGIPRYL